MTLLMGTGPIVPERESVELLRLSPITNRLPAGIDQLPRPSRTFVGPLKT